MIPTDDGRWPGCLLVERWLLAHWKGAAAGFFGLFVAYGFLAFNQTLAGDEWPALGDVGLLVEYPFRNGRWLQGLAMVLLDFNQPAPTLTMMALMLMMTLAFCLAATAIGLSRQVSVALFVVMAGCFPFWAEMVNFRQNHLAAGIATLSGVAYGVFHLAAFARWERDRRFTLQGVLVPLLAGALSFSFCAGAYQGFLPLGVQVSAGALLAAQLRDDAPNFTGRSLWRLVSCLGLILCLGVLFYAAQVEVSRLITGIAASENPNYQLSGSIISSWSEGLYTLARAGSYMKAFFFDENHLFPVWPKVILLAGMLILLCLLCSRLKARGMPAWSLAIVLLSIAILLVSPWALGMIRTPNSYRYNAIITAGMIYPIILLLLYEGARRKRVKQAVLLAAVAVSLSFIFEQNVASQLTHNNNRRDFAIAQRLLDRIEQDPLYPLLKQENRISIVLDGDFDLLQTRTFQTDPVAGPLNGSIVQCGLLTCQNTNLRYAIQAIQSDRNSYFVRRIEQLPDEEADVLRAQSSTLNAWPAEGSVRVVGPDTVLVRLSRR